jgi:hypothetical protein
MVIYIYIKTYPTVCFKYMQECQLHLSKTVCKTKHKVLAVWLLQGHSVYTEYVFILDFTCQLVGVVTKVYVLGEPSKKIF